MKLEPINFICPKCGDARYMRQLVGEGVGALDVKCINCNSYYYSSELYKFIAGKKQTNADRIRSMSDEELADFMAEFMYCVKCWKFDKEQLICTRTSGCNSAMLDWLKEEVSDDDS